MFKYNLIKLHEKLLFSLCMRHTLTVITCLFPWKQQKRHNDAIRESIFNDKILFFHIVIFANNEQEPAYFACWNIKKKKRYAPMKENHLFIYIAFFLADMYYLPFNSAQIHYLVSEFSASINECQSVQFLSTLTYLHFLCIVMSDVVIFCQIASQMLSATWQRKYGLLMGMFKLLLYDQHPTLILWSSYIIRAIIFFIKFHVHNPWPFVKEKPRMAKS